MSRIGTKIMISELTERVSISKTVYLNEDGYPTTTTTTPVNVWAKVERTNSMPTVSNEETADKLVRTLRYTFIMSRELPTSLDTDDNIYYETKNFKIIQIEDIPHDFFYRKYIAEYVN